MFCYKYKLVPANKKSPIDYTLYKDSIELAIETANHGSVFIRDRKKIELIDIQPQMINIYLHSVKKLEHPARSLSALTRALTSYSFVWKAELYSKKVFNMIPISMIEVSDADDSKSEDMTNEDILKTMIDLLYQPVYGNYNDEQDRKEAIGEIKKILLPYYIGEKNKDEDSKIKTGEEFMYWAHPEKF